MKRPLLVLAMLLLAAPSAIAQGVLGAQFRYWEFSNGNDLRDPIVYFNRGPWHVQLEYWDLERGEDQFRPELGYTLRDSRRSTYTVQWRHERDAERLWFMTEQVVGAPFVLRAVVSPIIGRDESLTVLEAGADAYFGSFSFLGATVIRDPRGDDRWVLPVRARLASESNDWVQATVAPASERTLGWALDARFKLLRLGVERNNRFDFTDLDNTIYTIGLEVALSGAAR